jgi:hypothetical protein
MSYLDGCGAKAFQDLDAPCGVVSPQTCQCGGQTQNSYQALLAIFGPGEQAAACQPGGCADGEICLSGRCVIGPGQSGGLGESCIDNRECGSGLCGHRADGSYCSEPCDEGLCPDGFECTRSGSDDLGRVCWPTASVGGCCVGHPANGWPLAIALMAGLVVRRRRARRRGIS